MIPGVVFASRYPTSVRFQSDALGSTRWDTMIVNRFMPSWTAKIFRTLKQHIYCRGFKERDTRLQRSVKKHKMRDVPVLS